MIGSGLTMADVALTLGRPGTNQRLFARSRTGLLPAEHSSDGFVPWPGLDLRGVTTATTLLGALREAVADAQRAGWAWHNVASAARCEIPASGRRFRTTSKPASFGCWDVAGTSTVTV